jgi:CHASE2 domain-containing sensor protein/class 3 adenylate cyclase
VIDPLPGGQRDTSPPRHRPHRPYGSIGGPLRRPAPEPGAAQVGTVRMVVAGRFGRLVVGGLVAVVVSTLLIGGLSLGLFAGYQAQATDALFPTGRSDPRLTLVAVDRRALADTGLRWPWPRDEQARLIATIAAMKPAVIVVDIVYNPGSDQDAALAGALRAAGNVIVASAPQLQRATAAPLLVASQPVDPVDLIRTSSASVGVATITPDVNDGVVREVPTAVEASSGSFVPSLALAAVAAADHAAPLVIVRPHGVQVGARYVPTSHEGRLRIAYAAGLSAHGVASATVSAGDVLAGRVPGARLAGRIVFVGVTDPTLGDTHDTPIDKGAGAPGVLIHLNALNTILTGNYLSGPSRSQTVFWLVVLAALIAGVAVRVRVWAAALLSAAIGIGYFVAASVRFDAGAEVDVVYPLLAVALAFLGGLLGRSGMESRERRRMAGLLEQYVPATVARQLVAGRSTRSVPSGQITFLFTDVVGSTELWDRHPKQMAQAMRRHDALIEAVVDRTGGAVVRPRGEGDSRFCIFVDPVDAATAAVRIHADLNAEPWTTPDPVVVRIGIHVGEAELREGDYYGSSVNRCARIRSIAQPGETLLSEAVAVAIGDALTTCVVRDRGIQELRGLADAEHVFVLEPTRSEVPA